MSTPADVSSPQWFSIKEAAEYLSISEPTLYRWMQDGKITYRKVGDSTRFLKVDLDAVVEVHPSEKELVKVELTCPVCNHDEMIEGRMESTGRSYFVPKKTKFWTLKDSNVESRARMCSRCGYLMLFGDVAKLEALIEHKDKMIAAQEAKEPGSTKKEM
jgi:excisionase family DNA binding protein